MGRAVGIDLGTTNSVIAAMEGGQPQVIPNAEGNRTTPSVVGFLENGERLVGQMARRQAILNPKGTIYSAKRFIGRKSDEVSSELTTVSLDVVAGPDGLTPSMIAEQLGMAPSALSFHLKELTHAALVTSEPRGRNLIYRANFETMNSLLGYLTEHCCEGVACEVNPAGDCKTC